MELKSKLVIYNPLFKYEASYLFSFLYLICRNFSLLSVWLNKAPKERVNPVNSGRKLNASINEFYDLMSIETCTD